MIRKISVALALACAVLSPASAAQWNVDHGKSHLGFTVQWSGQPFVATFKVWNAEINFDPADLGRAKASVTIDLGSETSGISDNDDGLKGAEGFAVGQYPTALFQTAGFTAKGGQNYVATGRLTIHGITRLISLPFALTISGNTAHMTGRTVVMRTDFGLGRGEWASPETIAHEVTINIDLTATKAH